MGRKAQSARNQKKPAGQRAAGATAQARPAVQGRAPVPVPAVPAPALPAAAVPAPAPPRPAASPGVPVPGAVRPPRTACYVDFENLFYNLQAQERNFSVAQAARRLNQLSRQICGEAFAHTAVYANWDNLSARSRYAQDDWAQVGWRTVAVPTREDQVSKRNVKNMVDFVMSLDILEDARDRGYEHFVIVSGDADFCEVVERLKRLRRKVTVVSLGQAASYRLSEAADRLVRWEPEDISGKDTFPLKPAERPPRVPQGLRRDPDATELDLLRTALRVAEGETGPGLVDWETVRDEYYLPLARCSPEEADTLVRELAQAGFVVVEHRRVRDGSLRNFLRIPM